MQLGIVLLFIVFILCAARTIEAPLRLLKMRIGYVAAASLLLMTLNAVVLEPTTEVRLNTGFIALFIFALLWAVKKEKGLRTLCALLCAVVCGIVYSLAFRRFAGTFLEPGLLLGLLTLPFAFLFRKSAPLSFLLAAAAPFFMALCETILDLREYGYTIMVLGDVIAFDAQVAGGVFALAMAACVKTLAKKCVVVPNRIR